MPTLFFLLNAITITFEYVFVICLCGAISTIIDMFKFFPYVIDIIFLEALTN
jgi:hypothetical protein